MCGRGSSSPWPLQGPHQEHSGNEDGWRSCWTEWPPGFPQFLGEQGQRSEVSGAEHSVWSKDNSVLQRLPTVDNQWWEKSFLDTSLMHCIVLWISLESSKCSFWKIFNNIYSNNWDWVNTNNPKPVLFLLFFLYRIIVHMPKHNENRSISGHLSGWCDLKPVF